MIRFLFLKKLWLFIFHVLQLLAMGLDFILFSGKWKKRWRKEKTEDILKQYYAIMQKAFVTKVLDTDTLPLTDDVSIIGPNERFDTISIVLPVLKQFIMIVNHVEIKKQFFNETSACTILDCVTSTPAASVPIVEWIEVKNGKIQVIHLYYDTAKWKQTQ